jgi:hypothetical protein
MRLAGTLVPALADDLAALGDDAADRRVRRRRIAPTLRQLDRSSHERVVFGGEHYFSRTSRIASRKSSTSEKLR